MKSTLRHLAAAGILILSAGSLAAQTAPTSTKAASLEVKEQAMLTTDASEIKAEMIKAQVESLGLDEKQTVQFEALELQRMDAIKAIQDDNSVSQELKKMKIRETSIMYQNKMKTILTEEQFEKYSTPTID